METDLKLYSWYSSVYPSNFIMLLLTLSPLVRYIIYEWPLNTLINFSNCMQSDLTFQHLGLTKGLKNLTSY